MTNPTAPPKHLSPESKKLWKSVLADYELEKNQMPPKRLPIDEAIRQIAAEAATAPDAPQN